MSSEANKITSEPNTTAEPDDASDKQISAVSRTMRVLETLSRYKGINLEQLAKKTDLPKATLLRFLSTLTSLGYVYRDPGDSYALTLKMFAVGSHSLEHIDLSRVARPVAEELAETLGETVHMGILEETAAVYIMKIESRYTIRMHSRIGKAIPLYCTAIGKLLLANLEAGERKSLLNQQKLVPFTPNTINTLPKLEKELAEIVHNGWAMDREEHETGISCIGAPVKDHTGKTVAALSVSWPMFRYEQGRFQEYVAEIQKAAQRISRLLGNLSEEADAR